MKYPLNRDKQKNNLGYLLGLLILVSTFFLWGRGADVLFSKIIFGVSVPFLKIENYFSDGLAHFMILFDDKKELTKQNIALNHRVEITNSYQLENRLLKEEVETLKKLLGRSSAVDTMFMGLDGKINIQDNKDIKVVLGYVLSGPVNPPYDSLIIDIGKEVVSIGSIALNEEGFVVGDIIESFGDSSKVKLLSSYGEKTDVFIGENKTMVSLIGTGSGNFFVSLPKDFPVENGDYAIYPGGGIKVIALVDSVQNEDGEIFKKVFLKSPFNVKNIRVVSVLNKIK